MNDQPKPLRTIPVWVAVLLALCVASATTLAWLNILKQEIARHRPFSSAGMTEAQKLAEQFGSRKSSKGPEEWIIRDYFADRRGGVFLDVGANHYRDENNTFFLETQLGWSGIAVDAMEEFGPDYQLHRPRTRYVAMFASDVTDSSVEFFVADGDQHLVSSSNPEMLKREGAKGTARTVPTTTLNAVLEQAQITKITFMSMDIELAEPKALAGFDVNRYKPDLVCIEAHLDVRQQILDYFAAHGYVLLGNYLRADPLNLYFKPR